MALSATSRQNVHDQILSLLARQSGLTARQISEALGISKTTVNHALSGPLKAKVIQDSTYKWSLANTAAAERTRERTENPGTELARLCNYYLDCISWDAQDGVSVSARSESDRDYVELDSCPFLESGADPLDNDAARQFIGRVRRDRTRVLHVGYPVRLRYVRARTECGGFRVEPILLFDLSDETVLDDAPPHLNFAVSAAHRQ